MVGGVGGGGEERASAVGAGLGGKQMASVGNGALAVVGGGLVGGVVRGWVVGGGETRGGGVMLS